MQETIKYNVVRPDKPMHSGNARFVVLQTRSGELGVAPHHANEICALGDGVMRITRHDGRMRYIVVSGGYAEITGDEVIVLANHARDVDDIDINVVNETIDFAASELEKLEEGDDRRRYFEHKIRWCNLLLSEAAKH